MRFYYYTHKRGNCHYLCLIFGMNPRRDSGVRQDSDTGSFFRNGYSTQDTTTPKSP